MIIEVTGVIEVGGQRSRDVPTSAHRAITVTRGASTTIRIRVIRSDGTPFAVAGSSVRVAARKSPRFPYALLVDAAPQPAVGPEYVDAVIFPGDTRSVEPGTYGWDAWLTAPGGSRHPIVLLSNFTVAPTAVEVP